MRERMIEDRIIETPFMVRGREGEKGVLTTSEFVDRGSCHAVKSKGALRSWPRTLARGWSHYGLHVVLRGAALDAAG
jgi:hypothetical protein